MTQLGWMQAFWETSDKILIAAQNTALARDQWNPKRTVGDLLMVDRFFFFFFIV